MNQSMFANKEIARPLEVQALLDGIAALSQETESRRLLEAKILRLMIDRLAEHGKSRKTIGIISRISRLLAEGLGMEERYCNRIEKASLVYDIGNIGVCGEVYNKGDEITFEEFLVLQYHTLLGYDILIEQPFKSMDMAATISAEHHEWYVGGGYPNSLEYEEIDMASRIVAVADTVGAMSGNRSGREVYAYEKIVAHVISRKETQFDPAVVDAFLNKKEEIGQIVSA